jgi:hypothetical protein
MLEAKILSKAKTGDDTEKVKTERCTNVRIHQNLSTALTHGNISASSPYLPNNVTVDQYPDTGGSCQSLA